jgi:hypothetical protein
MKYSVKLVKRPHIKATKKLNLTGDEGKQIIRSETNLTLIRQKTLAKLADMQPIIISTHCCEIPI